MSPCGWGFGHFIVVSLLVGGAFAFAWSLFRGLLEVLAWWLFMRGWSLKERR